MRNHSLAIEEDAKSIPCHRALKQRSQPSCRKEFQLIGYWKVLMIHEGALIVSHLSELYIPPPPLLHNELQNHFLHRCHLFGKLLNAWRYLYNIMLKKMLALFIWAYCG